jgi:phosphate starvation-inducible PhoH-like protein
VRHDLVRRIVTAYEAAARTDPPEPPRQEGYRGYRSGPRG